MVIFKTNGPGFWQAVRYCWGKYFWHNLTCELRRGRYTECIGYENTWYDRFLFSLGLLIMDPVGKHYKRIRQWDRQFPGGNKVYSDDTQWLRHPLPWVRRRARKHIAWIKSLDNLE